MKTETEPISDLEKLKKKTVNTATAAVILTLIGLMIFALGGMMIFGMANIREKSHLQNPDMPLNQYPQNASYVWTDKQILEIYWASIPIFGLSIITMISGIFIMHLLPDKKDFHKIGCTFTDGFVKKWNEVRAEDNLMPIAKYCPECGLKLSELEKKK